MSSKYRKIRFNEEGPYGSTEQKYLYAWFYDTCDIVVIYDENFDYIVAYGDRPEGMGWAIKQIEDYTDRLEPLTQEEAKKLTKVRTNYKQNGLTVEEAEYIWSLMPNWIKEQRGGLDPTFYGTGSEDGDKKAMHKVKKILGI